jgi:rhodanese-related sulfurtransferase
MRSIGSHRSPPISFGRSRAGSRPASRWLCPSTTLLCVLGAAFSLSCSEGDGRATARDFETDSVAAALEAEMAKFPERYAEEPVDVVDVRDVKALVERGADVVIIDAREPEAYAAGHLPGAVNYPYGNWLEEGKPLPPRDRDLIVYCNNQDCPISRLWAEQAVQRGYVRLRHMKAGLAGWREAGYPVDEGKS